MKYCFMTSGVATVRSICTIWPIFSSNVILFIKSLILAPTGILGSLYFRYSASPATIKQHSNRNPKIDLDNLPILAPQITYSLGICRYESQVNSISENQRKRKTNREREREEKKTLESRKETEEWIQELHSSHTH